MKTYLTVFVFTLAVFFAPPGSIAHAATASVSITEASIQQGTPYTVSWTSSGANSCTISGPGISSTALSGTQSVTQNTTGVKNYSISCSSPGCTWVAQTSNREDIGCSGSNNGNCYSGNSCSPAGDTCMEQEPSGPGFCNFIDNLCTGSCSTVTGSDSVTVTVAPAPTANLTASPASIAYGSSGTLTWSSTGASQCTGTGFSTGNATNNSTGVTITPIADTTYSITCTNAFGGTVTSTKIVPVTGVPAAIVTFSASPTSVALGSPATLTWSSTNASSCTGTGFSTGGNTSGSVPVTPATNTSYSITCTGQGGSGTASAGVGVTSGGASAVTVFDGNDGAMKALILPDANANGGVPFSDQSGIYGWWVNERDRTCTLVDPSSYPTSWSTRSYNSPEDNTVLKYNGLSWAVYGASGNNTKYSWLTCQTTAKPDASLTGNGVSADASITVASGSAVNLTWLSQYGKVRKGTCSAQNFATDTWVPGHYEDHWICEPSCGTGGNVCASAPHKQLAALTSKVLIAIGLKPETAHALGAGGGCVNDQVWVPGATSNMPFGGSTTVYPTVTTTYTYTCANPMGSVAKSITVNVPIGPQCADGLDNDSDGFCDATGCTVNGVALPADVGCTDAADTTEDPNPPLAVSCSAAPVSATVGQTAVRWSAAATGGNGIYTYSWSGTDSLSGTGAFVEKVYTLTGSKTASVTVTSGGVPLTVACDADSIPGDGTVIVSNPLPPSVSCTVSNSNPSPGEVVTYTATPANGGTSPYTWAPTDASKCVAGTGSTKNCTFTTPGALYAMSVTASGTGSPSDTCPTITVKTPTAYIEAVPDRVPSSGGTIDVKWSANQVSTCTVTRDGTSVWSTTLVSPATSIATTTLSPQPSISKQTTFAISCDGVSDSVIVNVVPKFDEF